MQAPAGSEGAQAPARLEVRDLRASFGGVRAIDGANLTVASGSVVGILGPNGSGKTSLLDAVSGQLRPSAGEVCLDGENLIDYLPEDRAALGVVRSFQDCRLYPELSVAETLMVAEDGRHPVGVIASTLRLGRARSAEASKRRAVDELLALFHLEQFRDTRIEELSTGTRRIVDLARVVSARPRLLLLDEPTAGIAQREAEAFVPLLRTVHELTGSTIVLVEHDVALAVSLCEELVVMEVGRVVSAGPTVEVLADPAAVRAYLGASGEAIARSNGRPAPSNSRPAPSNSRPARSRRVPRRTRGGP